MAQVVAVGPDSPRVPRAALVRADRMSETMLAGRPMSGSGCVKPAL